MTSIGDVLAVLNTSLKAVSRELKATRAHQADVRQVEMTIVHLHGSFPDPELWRIGGVLRRALMALEADVERLGHAQRQLNEFIHHVYWLGNPPGEVAAL